MRQQTHKLLRRSSLQPGESLPSLLRRLGEANFYDPPTIMNRLCMRELHERQIFDNLMAPYEDKTFEVLASVTGIDPRDLYASSYHRFAGILTRPSDPTLTLNVDSIGEVPSLSAEIRRQRVRLEARAQFCPECLSEAKYHRLIWSPISVTACLSHCCLLMDRCPSCELATTVNDVVDAQCRNCGFDLKQQWSTKIEGDELGLSCQRVLQAWLTGGPVQQISSSLSLPNEDIRALLAVMDDLSSSINLLQFEWHYLHSIQMKDTEHHLERNGKHFPTPTLYCSYATAFKAFLDWPNGFYRFLNEFRGRNPSGRVMPLSKELYIIYPSRLKHSWQGPAFRFIQDAFDDYVMEIYPLTRSVMRSARYRTKLDLTDNFAYLSYAQAAKLLGTSSRAIKRLVETGYLSSTSIGDCVARAEILSLRNNWSNGFSLKDTAEILGLSAELVVGLTKLGMLKVDRDPALDEGFDWLFSANAIRDCRGAIMSNVLTSSFPDKQALDLTEASRVLFAVGLNAAGILHRVAIGKLRCYRNANDQVNLGNIFFSATDIQKCSEAVRREKEWVRRHDIARLMGVKASVASRWVKAGLLLPVATFGNQKYFDSTTVSQFVNGYVFSEEAARVIGVGRSVIEKWAREGRLKPVSGPEIDGCHRYLFKREDVERLRPENRLTAPQMARELGISRSQIIQWVKRGKVRPISGPGIDGARHYLFEKPPSSGENLSAAPREPDQ